MGSPWAHGRFPQQQTIAIVASLVPFAWAAGVVVQLTPQHGTAGLTIILGPFVAYRQIKITTPYLMISFGGFLISSGGMTLSFLLGGRQFLFFSMALVLAILAPLLMVTTVLDRTIIHS